MVYYYLTRSLFEIYHCVNVICNKQSNCVQLCRVDSGTRCLQFAPGAIWYEYGDSSFTSWGWTLGIQHSTDHADSYRTAATTQSR